MSVAVQGSGSQMAPPDNSGFTLVELIIATAIGLIITGVLCTCIVVGLKNADASGQRLFNSHDAQIAQSYFTTDATSSDQVDADAGDDTCAADASDDLLVRFRWTARTADPNDPLTYEVATYATRAADGERQLVRLFCSSESSFGGVVRSSDVVLAHGLDPALLPSVTCTFADAPEEVSCASASAAKPFRTIRLTGQSTQTSANSADSLSYVLKASRRSNQS